LQVSVGNSAYTVAEDTRLTIDIPAAISIRTEAPGCSVAGTRVTCELGDLPEPEPNSGVSRNTVIALEIVAPEGSDVRFDATAEAFSTAGEETPANNRRTMSFRNYRTFYVTNTSDDGSGSLRQAIHSANASCDADPCLIAFRIENAGPFASIQPGTPLPVLTAKNILLDGQTQHRYTNRTSELPRPLIELRGSRLTEGEGLVITTPCSLRVRGLAVNGFPGHALRISGRSEQCAAVFDSRVIEHNYLGTDVTGRIAVPNLRGIYMDGHANPRIADNVISGNTRAGIFLAWGPHNVITRNVIGLDATGTAALGNGASGIYVSAEAEGTDVFDNHVAFNGDAGVSVARNLRYVNVYRNAIHANRQLAIDYGLDGPTLDAPIPAVDVTFARYDAASNTTTIAVSRPLSNTSVDIYANDAPDPGGYGEAQYYLGTARHNGATQRYELVYPGDLRGKWVAAQAIQIIITTFSTNPRAEAWGPYSNTTSSELGRAVEVR
ncbi:MAG TPA: right-handed parallel beta-helix repeat-containing protein, partial [Thermoanaerobaculia bacterium]